jgi:hypothetical protein
MTDPEVLKQLFKEAREEVKNWPEWMKREEQERERSRRELQCSESDSDQRLSA